MTPTCLTCGREVEEGRTCCHTCLAELDRPGLQKRCLYCGYPVRLGENLCDFCVAKWSLPQSYPPSIVPAAVDAMKAALIDSALLRLEEIEAQAAAVKTLLMNLKGAGV